jgi:hypothetical protein
MMQNMDSAMGAQVDCKLATNLLVMASIVEI